MKKSISKTEAKNQIEEFFQEIKSKTPKEIKKIKRLGMSYNIALKEKRKLFCGKCFSAYRKLKVRIRNNKKIIECENCGNVARWKL